MVEKKIIEKTINNLIYLKNLETKCSRTTLTGKDKDFIQQFQQDRETGMFHETKTMDEQLELWEKHCEAQKNHKYTQAQEKSISKWGHTGYMKINGKIYNTERYQKKVKEGIVDKTEINTLIKNLQSAIDESPRVPNDTVTYREGHWEKGHKTGDVIVQKGFASTSYTGGMDASGTDDEHSYEITYYIRAGAKGLALDDTKFNCLDEEELLLGRNTRQYILEQNDDEHTVSVLILPDR